MTIKVFIPNGKQVCFNFTNNVTVVESISFTSKKTMGKTTAIVEDLKNKSSLVTDLPEGIVYKSFNVWVGNAGYGESDNILNATVGFKVEKSWLDKNNVDPGFIVLNKYDDDNKTWIEIPTAITNEDDQFVYFTAKVPSYSSFVITGKGSSQLDEEPIGEPFAVEVRSAGNATVTGTTETSGFMDIILKLFSKFI